MVHAYHVTGLDFHAFMPLIESLVDSGDLQPGTTAIAFPKEDPSAKTIYVASTIPILKDTEDIKMLDTNAFAEVCRLVSTGAFSAWGAVALFGGTPHHHHEAE
ncbi:MAG TPA: hypothetical protein VGN63_03295 [Flavisolibacter sp.]|nr:hypothetical protein [Flavisolibacter sp.]